MPNKNSKKKKNRRKPKNKLQESDEKTAIESEQNHSTNPTVIVESEGGNVNETSVDSSYPVVVDNRISEEASDLQENENSGKVKVKKKRLFSFLHKKRSASVMQINTEDSNEMSGIHSESATVKRAHSISVFGRDEHQQNKSRIPLHRFRHKKNKGMMGSTGNIETSSLVINPGMDNWRMEGLLHTAENANSVRSLNTSTNISMKLEKETVADSLPDSKDSSENIEMKEGEENKHKQGVNKISNDNGDKSKQNEEKESNTTPPQEKQAHPEQVKLANEKKENKTQREVEPKPQSQPQPEIFEGSPTMKDALTDGDIFEFEDNSVVIVQNLDDVAREQEMHFPADVTTNDWLVLNFSSTPRVIKTF